MVFTSTSPNGTLFVVEVEVEAEFNKPCKFAFFVTDFSSDAFSEFRDSLANFWLILLEFTEAGLAGINLKVMVLELFELRDTGCFFEVSFKTKFGEVESIDVFVSS